jgi:hypothetical protein
MPAYRTIYIPHYSAKSLSEPDLIRLEEHLASLQSCYFRYTYYVIDNGSAEIFVGEDTNEYNSQRNEFPVNNTTFDLFEFFYPDGFYNSPNDIFVIDTTDFDVFNKKTGYKICENAYIEWDGNSVDFIINNLSAETLKHTWFNETYLLPEDAVIFIDGTDAETNNSIKKQLKQSVSLKQPCIFLEDYLPDTNTLLDYLDYFRPDINHKTLQQAFSNNNIPLLANALKVNFGLETCPYPLLIKSIKTYEAYDNELYSYNIKFFTDNTFSEIAISTFLALKPKITSSRFPGRFKEELNCPFETDDLPFDDPFEINIDRNIESNIDNAYLKLSDIIWDKLSYLDKVEAKLMLAEVLRQTLRVNDEKQMLALINTVAPVKLNVSRLVITDTYRLFLADYSNREVKMGNLPKALYFLFLKHPNGLHLKNIEDYKEELYHLYLKVTNFSDTEKLKQHINLLTDLQDNSIYVNMARIKAGFTKVMDDVYAQNYYPTGEYPNPKKIALAQTLIDFPPYF